MQTGSWYTSRTIYRNTTAIRPAMNERRSAFRGELQLEADRRDRRGTDLTLERFLNDLGDVRATTAAAQAGAGLPGHIAQRASAVLDGPLDLAIGNFATMADEHAVRSCAVRGHGSLRVQKLKINVDFIRPGENHRRKRRLAEPCLLRPPNPPRECVRVAGSRLSPRPCPRSRPRGLKRGRCLAADPRRARGFGETLDG